MFKFIAICIILIISGLILSPLGYAKYTVWDASNPQDDDSFLNQFLSPLTPNAEIADIHQAIDSNSGPAIIDVRSQDKFDEAHLPGAILIPEQELYQKIPEMFPDKNKTIYVYSSSKAQGLVSARLLKVMGYDRAFNVEGGIDYWKKLGYPIETNNPIYF